MDRAMRIMSTWWYPSTGISPATVVCQFLSWDMAMSGEECDVLDRPTANRMVAIATAFLCDLHYSTPTPTNDLCFSSFRDQIYPTLFPYVLGDTYGIQVSQSVTQCGNRTEQNVRGM